MQPEQFEALARFCEDVSYDPHTGVLSGARREFEPQLDHVLVNRRKVDKGRVIAMLFYGYPHLLHPAAHLNIQEDDVSRWALTNLRYAYEPDALNPLGLAEGAVFYVRGGMLHRLILPVGTAIQGNVVVNGDEVDINGDAFFLDAHGIIPTLTRGEQELSPTPEVDDAYDDYSDEDDYGDIDDLA